MQLNLVWTSFRSSQPPYQKSIVIEQHKATIGRATGNNFVLHDPERITSRHHASIEHHAGEYFLIDHSSTMTIINHQHQIHNGQRYKIHHNDVISIGDSEITASFIQQQATPQASNSEFDINKFFDDEPQPIDKPEENIPTINPSGSTINDPQPFVDILNEQQTIQENKTHQTPSNEDHNSTYTNNLDSQAILAFFQQLNFDQQNLSEQDKVEIMSTAGYLLNTLTQGIIEILKARKAVKDIFNVDDTVFNKSLTNPFKFFGNANEALNCMLNKEKYYMHATDAANEAVNDAEHYQVTMVQAMQGASEYTLKKLEPTSIEKQLKEQHKFIINKDAKYWRLYKSQFSAHKEAIENLQDQDYKEKIKMMFEKK